MRNENKNQLEQVQRKNILYTYVSISQLTIGI